MKHIVYEIVFNRRKENNIHPFRYIGSKSNCEFINGKILDKNLCEYYGSSSFPNWKQIVNDEIDHMTIRVLKQFDIYVDALNFESALQKSLDVVSDITYFNLSVATVNNYTDPNYATYKHKSGNKTVRLPKNHPKVLNGEYVGVTKGTVLSTEQSLKKGRSGKDNAFYGKRHTEEVKALIREKKLQRGDDRKPESIQAFIENVAKAPKSPEHRKKIGRKGYVTLKNIDTLECIRIKQDDRHLYDSDVWMNPIRVKCLLNKIGENK